MDDLYYLKRMYQYALEKSTDPSTQCGTIMVNKDGDIVSFGANHFPKGVKETKERWQRPKEGTKGGKYSYVEHGERNCIYDASKRGICTNGLKLYISGFPCEDCARAIIQSGISEITIHALDNMNNRWGVSFEIAKQMLDEAGIKTNIVTTLVGLKIRRNGQMVNV